jgi:hypothetical protein
MAADGLRIFIVGLGYLLPIAILSGLVLVPISLVGNSSEGNPSRLALPFIGLSYLFFGLYGLALTFLQPAVFAVFIADHSIGQCFSPRRIRQVIASQQWMYLAVVAVLFGVGQLISFGFILLIVGVAFTAFYYLVVYAGFAGQLARPLLPGPPAGLTAYQYPPPGTPWGAPGPYGPPPPGYGPPPHGYGPPPAPPG